MFIKSFLPAILATGALALPSLVKKGVATVTNQACFTGARGGCASTVNDYDGTTGADVYTYYSGVAANFPARSSWTNFEAMFAANTVNMQVSCGNNGWGANDSPAEIADIRASIESVAAISGVDHRFILAVMMQESVGCVRVPTTNNGVVNPGLMQSHNGATFNAADPAGSIQQMIIDGTQGTAYGDGLAQGLNTYGDVYEAARVYNSGSISSTGDLSNANGATACYVSDIANRLTGWVNGARVCSGSSSGGTGTTTPPSSCTYTVVSGDSCWAIWTKYGLTEATFRSYNPSLDSACDIQVGEVVSLCSGTTTGTGSTGSSGSCTHTVVSGDTCWALYTAAGLTEAQFLSYNPSLDSACDLYVGNVVSLCSGTTTSTGSGSTSSGSCTHTVVSGDTCWALYTAAGLTEAQFLSYNPSLDSACDLYVGNVVSLCSGTTTSTGSGSTSSGSCTHTVVSGDTCWALYTAAGLTEAQFLSYNPSLDSACDLYVGNVVSLCSGTTTSSGSSSGTSEYTVVSGDSCWSIWTKFGITEATLRSLNPFLDAACDLYVGNVLTV